MSSTDCLDEQALLRLARNDGWTRVSTLQDAFPGVELQAAEARIGVAGKAILDEQGTNAPLEEFFSVLGRTCALDRNGGTKTEDQQRNQHPHDMPACSRRLKDARSPGQLNVRGNFPPLTGEIASQCPFPWRPVAGTRLNA